MANSGLHRQTFSNLNTSLTFRLPDAIGAELRSVAKAENVRQSDVIRYALIRYLMERRSGRNV